MSEGQSPIPGWYNDPFDASQIRWWDGAAWTEHAKPLPAPEVPEIQPPAPPAYQYPPAPAQAFPTASVAEPGITPGLVDPGAAAASVLPGVEQSPPPVELPPMAQDYATPAPPFEPSAWSGGQYQSGVEQVMPQPSASAPQAAPGMPQGIDPGQPFGQAGGGPAQFGQGTDDYQPTYGGAVAYGAEAAGQAGNPAYGSYAGYSGQPGGTDGGVAQQAYTEPAGAQPTSPPAKSSKMMLVLLIILGVVVIAAAAVWFFMLRSSDTPAPKVTGSAPAATPASPGATSANPGATTTPGAPAAGAIAPASCSSAIAALTADGSASTVVARLEAAATNQSLAEAAGFFTDVTQQTAELLASNGSPCVDAAKAGQAPATYATFIEQFSKATHDGAAIAGQGAAANGILTPEQAAALRADASALASAQTAVAPGAASAAPAPAS